MMPQDGIILPHQRQIIVQLMQTLNSQIYLKKHSEMILMQQVYEINLDGSIKLLEAPRVPSLDSSLRIFLGR
jgi:hypothetical protein